MSLTNNLPQEVRYFRRFAACRELSKAKCRRVLRLGREFMGIWFATKMASKQKESMNVQKSSMNCMNIGIKRMVFDMNKSMNY